MFRSGLLKEIHSLNNRSNTVIQEQALMTASRKSGIDVRLHGTFQLSLQKIGLVMALRLTPAARDRREPVFTLLKQIIHQFIPNKIKNNAISPQ
jgi:hypothetical protein